MSDTALVPQPPVQSTTWYERLRVPPGQRFTGITAPSTEPSFYKQPLFTPPAPPGPDLGTIAQAAIRRENELAALADITSRPVFPPDPNYDVAKDQDVVGAQSKYQAYLDNFIGVQSKAETQSIMSRIDREDQDLRVLAEAGLPGLTAAMASGLLGPSILIPIGGWLKLTGTAGRVARIGTRAAEFAAAGAAAGAAHEAIQQTAQETRSFTESAWTVVGAAALTGILGGIVGRSEISASTPRVGAELEGTVPRAGSAGAASAAEARGSAELAPSFGVAQALRPLTPGLRTQTSEIAATRNVVRDLIAGEPLAENEMFIPSSVGGSAEAQAMVYRGAYVDALENMRSRYSDYFFGRQVAASPILASVSRILGRSGDRMSYYEFRQAVSDALLAGDVHPIPQVEAAARYWRANVLNPLRDEAMNLIPGFRELVEQGSADTSYLTRVWNRAVVRASRDELRGILMKHFEVQQQTAADLAEVTARRTGADVTPPEVLTRQELQDAADSVIDNILGQSPTRIAFPNEFNVGVRGPLKERALRTLPTAAVRKFVERDIDKIGAFYTRSLGADVALSRKFGSVDLKDQIAKIRDEATARGRDQSAAVRQRLDKQAASDIRDIQAMRDRLRGTFRLPDNPEGLLHRASVVLRTANFLSSLGMMTISSISDIGKPVLVHGLTRTMRAAFQPLLRGMKPMKLAAKEVKLAGTALDMATNDRILEFADLVDQYGTGTIVERGLEKASRSFSVATLMAPWNATWKQFAGIIAQTRVLQSIEALAAGRAISKKDIAYLTAGGIDRSLADKIAAQFAKHGEKAGEVWQANTQAWTNPEAVRAFRSFIARDVDRVIVTPGVGDKPLWMSGDLGSIIGQFQSFAMSSVQKTLISGLQQRDMEMLNGMMVMLGLGTLSYYMKTKLAGYEVSDDPRIWAAEAVDNSGILGILMNANHAIEKVTEDKFGISALTGQPARRYINVNKLGAFLGPSLGKVSDILDVMGATSNANWTASDVHKARKLIPLQNLWYTRWLFDKAEQGTVGALGIPQRKTN